jgi:hypothetical protein
MSQNAKVVFGSEQAVFSDDEIDMSVPPILMKKPSKKAQGNHLSDRILNSDNLFDHTKCTCGSVFSAQYKIDSEKQSNKETRIVEVERKVIISSDHIAWFFSSKHLLNILEKKSGADVRGNYIPQKGLVIILVGQVEAVSLAVDLIKQMLMFGVDHLMTLVDA